MPRSSCDFCCNPVELARYEPTWRGQVAGILCEILAALEGGGPGGGCTCVEDGAAVNPANTGGLILGTDGTNYQVVSVSATGALNVNGVQAEDVAAAGGDLGFPILAVQNTTPASTASDGDYGWLKTNSVGALYQEPSNQAATYGGTTTSGAAGAVTTSGVNVHTNAAKAKIVTVTNTLDVPVQISLDGGTTYIAYVAVNGGLVLDLGTSGRWTASNIFARAIGADSISGNIYVGTII